MYKPDLFQIYVLEDSSSQISLLAETVVQVKGEATKPQIIITPNTGYIITSTCLIVAGLIAFCIFLLRIQKFRLNKKLTTAQLQQIPCRSCQYFKNNSYLNCAVHPSMVLTEKALNCPDYCSDKFLT
jgi:hypothetical protein